MDPREPPEPVATPAVPATPAPRDPLEVVRPEGYPAPRGYENGVVGRGRALHVAGQIGWELDGTFASDELAPQLARALDHVLAVVRAAGGGPEHVASMTVYVTDLDAYRASRKAIGEAWRARFGRRYPAMALVGVAGLLEPRAKVEVQAVAHLPGPIERPDAPPFVDEQMDI